MDALVYRGLRASEPLGPLGGAEQRPGASRWPRRHRGLWEVSLSAAVLEKKTAHAQGP